MTNTLTQIAADLNAKGPTIWAILSFQPSAISFRPEIEKWRVSDAWLKAES